MLHSAGYYELLRGFVSFFIPLLWLQVGILMGDIFDAGTILLGIEVVVPYNHGAGVTPVKLFEQSSHGSLLCLSACVGGLTSDVQPTLVADAY